MIDVFLHVQQITPKKLMSHRGLCEAEQDYKGDKWQSAQKTENSGTV